jgi:hypothetical protein
MRNENQHPELTNKEGSFVNALVKHEKEFEAFYAKNDFAGLKNAVYNAVISANDKPLEKKSQATKRFIMSLNKQRNCNGIITLVWNARLKGDNLGVL